MTPRARFVASVSAVVAGIVTTARADPPRVDLSHCTAFNASALRDAIARELPSSGGDRPYAVIVACPDLVTANLHVEPVPEAGSVARSLDLGEVPGDLRIKLLALAIAELAEVAAQLPDPRASPGSTKQRSSSADPRDPQSLADLDPRTSNPTPVVPPTPMAPPERRVAAISPPAIDTAIAPSRSLPSDVGTIVGVRMFARQRTALLDAGAELALPWLRVGLRGAVGHGDDVLGTYTPWLATVTIARELACVGVACGLVRGDVGLAGVAANATNNARAADASSGYAAAMAAIELRHRVDDLTLTASIEAGYAAGMVARAETRVIAALAGFVGGAGIGVRW